MAATATTARAAAGSTRVSHAPSAGFASGMLLVLGTVLIWGSQFPVAKSAFEHVDAYHTAVFRYGFAATVLLTVLLLREGWSALRFDRQAGDATVVGLIGMCGSPSLVFGGLMFTRPEIAAIIIAVQPSMTALAEWVFKGRRPSGFSIACIGLAFVGVFTAVTHWSTALLSSSRLELIGAAMIFVGALCWVYYTISGERFRNWSILRLTALTMLPGMLGHVAVVLVLTALGLSLTPAWPDWWAARYELLFLALPGVLLAMLLWNAGTKRIGPLNAMLFINLIPVVTFAVRHLQGYTISPYEVAGAAMVIVALVANNLALRWQRRPV